LQEKERLTNQFGGYGVSIDVGEDRQIANSAFAFKSMTADVFQNDVIGCSTQNLDFLTRMIGNLESLIAELS
jgi:hypothetical protein